MPKHARKRQKSRVEQPLVDLAHAAPKDDEERRLEGMLFGVPYLPPSSTEDPVMSDDGQPAGASLRELEHMLDSDLFFIDAGEVPSSSGHTTEDETPRVLSTQSEAEDADDDEEREMAEEAAAACPPHESDSDLDASTKPVPPHGSRRAAPAWIDHDDESLHVSLASHSRLRKLRDAPAEDSVTGRVYERKLRRQFERLNPTPEWATTARKRLHASSKRRRSQSPDSDADLATEALLTSTAGISAGKKSGVLAPGIISIERLRDANQAAPAEGEIKSVQFHPSPQIPVLLTASTDRRLRLFHVDGLTNPHAQTLHVPSLPVTHAVFHPSGSSILMTGPRPFYYTYDLQSGTSHRSPRGLWGTTFANQDASMETCAFSPDGDVLAVAGRRGHVHLVDWRSGAAQVVASLKANAAVRSLWWSRRPDADGGELLSLTEDSHVYVWDVRTRRCARRWQDDGGFGSRIISGDRQGHYLSIGSNTGLVNVYDSNKAGADPKPKPLKTIGNLTTNISCLRYNDDSQLLAMASSVKKDQMRLIHLPSLTAYGNWPTSSTPLGHVTSMDFSNGSAYLAIGNNRGRVLLYHLREFAQQ